MREKIFGITVSVYSLLALTVGSLLLGASLDPRLNVATELVAPILIFGVLGTSFLLRKSKIRWLGMPSYWMGIIAFVAGVRTNVDRYMVLGAILSVIVLYTFVEGKVRMKPYQFFIRD